MHVASGESLEPALVNGHVGRVGAGAVLAEQLDDRLLAVADGAQRVAERRGGAEVGDRVEAFAAQALSGTRRGR